MFCEQIINVYSQIKLIKPDEKLHLPAIGLN